MRNLNQLIDLSNKVALITGGAMGIGYGIAYRLAEAGANVAIVDFNEEIAEKSADALRAKGWKATAFGCDVSKSNEVQEAVQKIIVSLGGIDILVNDAGIYPNIPITDMKEADFDRILSVNLKSVFLCTQAVAKQMIQQGRGGKIINITSVDAVHPSMVGLAIYDATKHGIWGFTKNAALELAAHKIQVNAIAPGGIATPGTGTNNMTKKAEEAMKPFIEKIPMKRIGEPDDIGKVALFLASDLSSYMTGSQVVVDGGVLLA